jgi:predicted pyridoxine 5'-phosphate oxidase superfamily flavin-nucleotide-binding protein
VKLPAFGIDLITMFPLGFVATVTAGGRPNVSPKGTFLVLDDRTLAFGEIRSPQTVTNLTNQPELEVNFVDQWTRKGVRVRGKAQMVRRGTAEFGGLIEQLKPISTPPYDDGATEEDMIATFNAKFAETYP